MEFPGGFKVDLLDLQEITSRADSVDLLPDKQEDGREPFLFELVASQDPNLALAGLRIEIERRLTLLARASGTQVAHPMGVRLNAHHCLPISRLSPEYTLRGSSLFP